MFQARSSGDGSAITIYLVIQAALNGVGLGLAFEGEVEELISKRRLIGSWKIGVPHSPFLPVLPEPPPPACCLDSLISTLRLP